MASFSESFSFHLQLWYFYEKNRNKIRSRYKDLTRKFLDYNDKEKNPNAYLRRPQFEALEMYVFIKEFTHNKQVYQLFDDWRNKREYFAEASYYSIEKSGQARLFDELTDEQTETIFTQMEHYKTNYPNYIYALAMGVGKTHLMATCIFYEFLLARRYPKDKSFCHNALVFAPDKTVLHSLHNIITFDKSKVVPPEDAKILEANIKFHFLDESSTLDTIDGSDFNVIISNTQKIIVKTERTEKTAAQKLFTSPSSLLSDLYGDVDNDSSDAKKAKSLMGNQRFEKLCRLPQMGIYVDEAHHLYGADLTKSLTAQRNTIDELSNRTNVIACYNYTGTPYVDNQLLPEVVYAYGLKKAIWDGYLKDARPIEYQNVRDDEYLKSVVHTFWESYGNKTYEGLNPKLAIYAATIEDAEKKVRPTLEKILVGLGIPNPMDKILVYTGDVVKDSIRHDFNNLDVKGSSGNEKQFIILVGRGKEGWDCRSLFGVALYRNPQSAVFVLQSTMRCMRAITTERQTATVFLSSENYKILDQELHKNFNMSIKDITNSSKTDRRTVQVRVRKPPEKIILKRIWHEYSLHTKEYKNPVDFNLKNTDLSKYTAKVIERGTIAHESSRIKETNIDYIHDNQKFSAYTITGEISRYLNLSPILIDRILKEAVDGIDTILNAVNKYNDVLYDIIIPGVFKTLFEVKSELKSEDKEVFLLREPKDGGYYEFSAKEDLIITSACPELTEEQIKKSFHADTYCFDSDPEKKCFWLYLDSKNVEKIFFTGMFTANQGDLYVQYYDPESGRIRQYYPDFLAKMKDGSYQLIEVKGDNMIEDEVVKAKRTAAEEMANAMSKTEYLMYAGSKINAAKTLDDLVPEE